MRTAHRLLLLLGIVLSISAHAQNSPNAPSPDDPPDLKAAKEALKLREDAVDAITKGTEKSSSVLNRLKAHGSPSGLKMDHDADYALAAIDMAHRLLVKGRGEDAVVFFKAAEATLGALVDKTPDAKADLKAFYLKQLAFIRGNYLNAPDQAKRDIDQAVLLQPKDKHLQQVRRFIASEHGLVFKDDPIPTKD